MSKNQKTRPISPHLSIYKPQISSVLSIGHRLSGVALFFVLSIFCWWFTLWVFDGFDKSYLSIIKNDIVQLLLVIASYGFFYHLCTGIRHLVWDTGSGFSISAVSYSGWLVILASFVFTAIYWLFI